MPVKFKTTKVAGRAQADPLLYEILRDIDLTIRSVYDTLTTWVLDLFAARVSGTPGKIAKWVTDSSLGDSQITEDGNALGFHEDSPVAGIHITQDGSAITPIYIDTYGTSSNIVTRTAAGTKASPTALTSGSLMSGIAARGYGTTGFTSASRANLLMWAAENWTDTVQGTYITISTTPIGSATPAEAVRVLPTREVRFAANTQGMLTKALTEGAATSFADISVASNSYVAGECIYRVDATDATDYQCRTGRVRFVAVNKGGTITASINEVGSQEVAVSSGTLLVVNSITTGTNKVTLQCNATSSLTQTTLNANYRVDLVSSTETVTPL